MEDMTTSRISKLRQSVGWTQERLATESTVSLRTIQRLEAGHDAGLETLSLIAEALRVPVRDLFESLDDDPYSERIESFEARVEQQQAARDRISGAWMWLYIGIGIVATVVSFTLGAFGLALFLAYWAGGAVILMALRRLYIEPHLDDKYPLSHGRYGRRNRASRTAAGVSNARPEN